MTSGRKTKPPKPDKTPAALRLKRRQAAYDRALRIAVDAIMEVKDIRPVTAAELLEQHLNGETLFRSDWQRIKAAASPTKRKPGRPAGSGAKHERRTVAYAIYRVFRCKLPTYRNPASSHRFTKVDAIAEAMRTCGFGRVCTYEAVAAEMRRQKPIIQKSLDYTKALVLDWHASKLAEQKRLIAELPPHLQAMALEFFAVGAVGDFVEKLDDNY